MYDVFVIALLHNEVRRVGFRNLEVKVYDPRPQRKSNMILLLSSSVMWRNIKRWENVLEVLETTKQTTTTIYAKSYAHKKGGGHVHLLLTFPLKTLC